MFSFDFTLRAQHLTTAKTKESRPNRCDYRDALSSADQCNCNGLNGDWFCCLAVAVGFRTSPNMPLFGSLGFFLGSDLLGHCVVYCQRNSVGGVYLLHGCVD